MNRLEVYSPCTSRGCSVEWSWCNGTRLWMDTALGCAFWVRISDRWQRCAAASPAVRSGETFSRAWLETAERKTHVLRCFTCWSKLPYGLQSSIRIAMNHISYCSNCSSVPHVSTYRIHNLYFTTGTMWWVINLKITFFVLFLSTTRFSTSCMDSLDGAGTRGTYLFDFICFINKFMVTLSWSLRLVPGNW